MRIEKIIVMLIFLISCNNNDIKLINTNNAIPSSSDVIIKINSWSNFDKKIQNIDWWKKLFEQENFEKSFELLNYISENKIFDSDLEKKELFLCMKLNGNKSVETLIISSLNTTRKEEIFEKLGNKIQEKFKVNTYEGEKIFQLELSEKDGIYFSVVNNIFLLSFSNIPIEKGLRQIKSNQNIFEHNAIQKLDKNLPKYGDVNVLIKSSLIEEITFQKNIVLNKDGWSCFDVELERDFLILNGVSDRGDVKYLNDSKYSDARESISIKILPRHVKEFNHYQINNDNDINEVLNIITDGPYTNFVQINQSDWDPKEIIIAKSNNEVINHDLLLFDPQNKSFCHKNFKKNINKNSESKISGFNISMLDIKKFNKNIWFMYMIKNWDKAYYTIINDCIVLSKTESEIKSIINNFVSNQTIAKSKVLEKINNELGKKSHATSYFQIANKNNSFSNIFNSAVSKNISDNNYFFNSLILLSNTISNSSKTKWIYNLKNETNYRPQIVTNHYTQDFEILTQDIENIIYLIDSEGREIWNRKIGNSIIGDVNQIDAFNNNKYQWMFNTRDSIYLIDRNGNNVKPFPIKTKKNMSVPIAVFDYDNNKNYRILIAMENELQMLDKRGKVIRGWEFNRTSSKISMTPEIIQLFNKDYIIVSEDNGQVHFLNRRGQSRIDIAKKIQRSKNKVNLIKGSNLKNSKLLMQDDFGKLISIYFDGRFEELTIQNLGEDDFFLKNENYTLVLNLNNISYKSNLKEFDISLNKKLTKPRVIYKNDSIFIATQCKTENLTYLINQNGRLHTEPYYGTTDYSYTTNNIKQGYINLIIGSQEGTIYNYIVN